MNRELLAIQVMEAALDLTGDAREAYIVDACSNDSKLLRKVRSLLHASEDVDGFLATRSGPGENDAVIPSRERIGDYRIVREIGRGGMGIVYEAVHDAMQRRVALKTLSAGSMPSEIQVARFYREARAAGQLHHTNIVPVFEVGSAEGLHYYTMQYIEGANLDTVIDQIRELRESGRLASKSDVGRTVANRLVSKSSERDRNQQNDSTLVAPTEDAHAGVELTESVFAASNWSTSATDRDAYFRRVAAIGLQATEALEYAHQYGTLHRDIKPANLMVDTDGIVWVLDFGLAKNRGEDLTASGDVLGTIRYMAPERFRGKGDERSDIYSLGLTLYELTTLQYAFDARDHVSLMNQVTTQAAPPPRSIDRRIPKDLETIILKSLDRNPNRRYDSASEMAEDLRLFIMDHPILARRISPLERAWRVCRRNPVVSTLAASLLALLAVIAIGSSRFAYTSNLQKLQANEERNKAIDAERLTRQRRYDLNYESARALRKSKDVGRRYDALESIKEAIELLPSLELSESELLERRSALRTEAAAALGLFDMKPIRTWPARLDTEHVVAFNQDHSMYALPDRVSGDIGVYLTDSDAPILNLRRSAGSVFDLAFSPDARFLLSKHQSDSTRICVWDLQPPSNARHEPNGQPTEHSTSDNEVRINSKPFIEVGAHYHGSGVFSRDGQTLAISSGDSVSIFKLPTGNLQTKIPIGFPAKSIQLSEDGGLIASCRLRGSEIEFWETTGDGASPKFTVELPEGADGIYSMLWSAERKLLIAGLYDGKLLVWRQGFEKEPESFQVHKHTVVRIHVHPHRPLIFTQGWDDTVRVFDLVTEEQVCRLERISLSTSGPGKDGRRIGLVSPERQRFGIWKMSAPCLKLFRVDQSNLNAVSVFRTAGLHPLHPNLLVSAHRGGIYLYETTRQKLLAHRNDIGSSFTFFSIDGESLFVFDREKSVRIPLSIQNAGSDLKVALGAPQQILGTLPRASTFELTPDQRQVLVVFNQNSFNAHAELVSLDDPDKRVRFSPHTSMTSASISPDGEWVSTSCWKGKGVKLWDAKSGKEQAVLVPDSIGTRSEFSLDGQFLVAAQESSIFVWSVGNWGSVEYEIGRKQGMMGDIAFAKDIFVANQTRFMPQLVDMRNQRLLMHLENRAEDVPRGYSFSKDGSHLAIAGTEYTHLWDLNEVREQLQDMGLGWQQQPH